MMDHDVRRYILICTKETYHPINLNIGSSNIGVRFCLINSTVHRLAINTGLPSLSLINKTILQEWVIVIWSISYVPLITCLNTNIGSLLIWIRPIDTVSSWVEVFHLVCLFQCFSRFPHIDSCHLEHRDHRCDCIVPLFTGSPCSSLMEEHVL